MPINNYIKWPAERIRQDENNRLISDVQITTWNGKADSDHNHDDKYIPLTGTTALTGPIIPSNDLRQVLGNQTHRFQNIFSGAIEIYENTTGKPKVTINNVGILIYNDSFAGKLYAPNLAANQYWDLPDKSGTIAMTTDIPKSLPASDVKDWAKADSKPTYTFAEITEKPEKFTPDTHTHTISEVTDLQTTLDGKASKNHVHDSEKVTNWNNAVVSGAYYAAADATNNPSADAAYSGNVVKGSTIVTQTVVKESIDGDLYKYIRRGQLDTNRTTVTTWGQWQEIQYVVTE